MKLRVLYIVERYPELSESYILNEIEHVTHLYELEICATRPALLPYRNHRTFCVSGDEPEQVLSQVWKNFHPQIVHFHYIHIAQKFLAFCEHYNVPFTVRLHSFDTLRDFGNGRDNHIAAMSRYAETVNSDLCLGVLSFPFTIEALVQSGMRQEKLVPTFPVVDVKRFFDHSTNGDQILNVGAAIPKKAMGDFMRLATLVPDKTFNLYAIRDNIDHLRDQNQQLGGHCNVFEAVQPKDMPAIYKRHRWLVYTASMISRNVGWPMAVAEAQAAGVGVCMANIRPDLQEYLGSGGGILFDDVAELKDIVREHVPEEMRERGFEQCWKSDIAKNISQLTDLWDSVDRHVTN